MSRPHDHPIALVAHEEALCRRLLQRLLERSGFQVRLATCAEGAFEALREQPAGRAMLGIASASRGGLDILREAKRASGPQRAHWIVVVDEWQQVDWEAARSLGAQELITRPFSPAQLLARIQEWIQTTNEGVVTDALVAPAVRTSIVEE